jgi:predicted O-methyltransferase YrrM
LTWTAPDRFSVDGVEFVESHAAGSTAELFHIRKRRALVEAYVHVLEAFEGANIVELGIAQGGSLALLALVASPRKVVALELSPERITGLDDLVAQRGLGGSVRAHYGVDQGDRDRVRQIVEEELGREPIDLVIDDASHLLGPTRASFEVLFPLLRPGGLFLIEDWNWQHKIAHGFHGAVTDPTSPQALAIREQLPLALAEADPDVVARFEAELAAQLADPTSRAYQQFAATFDERLDDPDELARFEQRMLDDAAPSADRPGPAPSPAVGVRRVDEEPPDDEPPLAALVVDLVVARGCSGDVVSEVTLDEFWATVRRGPATLDPSTFRLNEVFADPYGLRWD